MQRRRGACTRHCAWDRTTARATVRAVPWAVLAGGSGARGAAQYRLADRASELKPRVLSCCSALESSIRMLSVDDLTDDLLLRVFEHLEEPRSLATVEAVSPRWRCVVEIGHARCWRGACLRAWRLTGAQPSLRLPTTLVTPTALSAGWKDVLRDVYVRTSRAGGWAHARAKLTAGDSQRGAAMIEPPNGSTYVLPAGLVGDEDGELRVESVYTEHHALDMENGDVVRLRDEASLGGDRAARCAAPFPWIRCSWHYTELPSPCLGMPLLERTVAGSSADHVLRRRQFHYFEVAIRAPGDGASPAELHAGPARPCIAIGLATKAFNTNGKQPGWTRSSWGYHGDDGCIYHRNGNGTPWGPAFGTGDIVGCGLDCSLPCIWFTVNGRFVGISHDEHDDLHRGVRYFPVIGVDSRDEVELNTLGPFCFDLGRYQSRKDAAMQLCRRRDEQLQAQSSRSHRKNDPAQIDRNGSKSASSNARPAGASAGATASIEQTTGATESPHYRRAEQTESVLRELVRCRLHSNQSTAHIVQFAHCVALVDEEIADVSPCRCLVVSLTALDCVLLSLSGYLG